MGDSPPGPGLEDLVREIAEVGTGAAILALRQVNITRRRLVDEQPELIPIVDALLDQVEALTPVITSAIGAAAESVGEAVGGDSGVQISQTGRLVAELGPELLRLSGLTRRS